MSVGVATASAFEREPSLVQEHALGTLYETSDGRRYRYVSTSQTPIAVGLVVAGYMNNDITALHPILPEIARRGSTTIRCTNPTNLTPANTLAGGIVVVGAVAPTSVGSGHRIVAHTPFDGTALPVVIQLASDDPVINDIPIGAMLSFAPSPYARVDAYSTNPQAGPAIGVTIAPMPASSYGWVQTRGLGTLFSASATEISRAANIFPIANGRVDAVVTTARPVGNAVFPISANWAGACLLTFE